MTDCVATPIDMAGDEACPYNGTCARGSVCQCMWNKSVYSQSRSGM